jgi:hypothetical protein
MQLEGTLNLERKRVQRWVPIVAIVVPVFLFVAAATWFIRAFVAPPMVAIPAPMTMAAATLPERHPPPVASQLSAPSASAVVSPSSTGAIEPTSPRTLPMFATFAIAPPAASLRRAPMMEQLEPNAASSPAESPGPPAENAGPPTDALADLSKDRSDGIATAALDPSEPLAGPIPLPPQRRRVSALQPAGPVPLPRPRPETEASSADIDVERRTFSAHGAE